MNSIEIENGIKQIYANDSRLAAIIDVCGGCELTPKKDYYHAILRAIIAQQLSTVVARVIIKRVMGFYNNKPLPEKIISTPDEALRSLGVSWAKIKYLKDLSQKIIDKKIHFRNLNKKSDEEIIAEFTQVKGIGVWTAQMFLMFTLGRLNVLPVNDLGIRNAAMKLYKLKKLPDEKRLHKLSKDNGWHPYNSIACWYLWRSIDMKVVK